MIINTLKTEIMEIAIREDSVEMRPIWKVYFNGEYQTLSTSRLDAEVFKAKAERLWEEGEKSPEFRKTREYRRYFS